MLKQQRIFFFFMFILKNKVENLGKVISDSSFLPFSNIPKLVRKLSQFTGMAERGGIRPFRKKKKTPLISG